MSRGADTSPAELVLEVSVREPAFSPGDEIPVTVLLFNFGDDAVTVNARMALVGSASAAGEVMLEITGPEGAIPFLARVKLGRPGDEDFLLLQPWNCAGRRYELLDYFELDRPGDYEITAVYTSRAPDGEAAVPWVGTLRSEPARLRLDETAG